MIPLPAFIDQEAWDGFCEMRKAKGKSRPFTLRAAKMVLVELYKLREAGHDPNACLDQSTYHGWSDVYALKEKQIQKAPQPARNEALEAIKAHEAALDDPEARRRNDEARREAMSKIRPLKRVA